MEKPTLEAFALTEEQISSAPYKKIDLQSPAIWISHSLFLVAFLWYINYQGGDLQGPSLIDTLFNWIAYGIAALVTSCLFAVIADAVESQLLRPYHPNYYKVLAYREALKAYQEKNKDSLYAIQKMQDIVCAYGKVLEDTKNLKSTTNFGLRDISELPYPKEMIKQTLFVLLKHPSLAPDEAYKQALITGYTSLSDFQPNVGKGVEISTEIDVQGLEAFVAGFEATEEARKTARNELYEAIDELKALGCLPSNYNEILKEKTKELIKERGLEDLGLDIDENPA